MSGANHDVWPPTLVEIEEWAWEDYEEREAARRIRSRHELDDHSAREYAEMQDAGAHRAFVELMREPPEVAFRVPLRRIRWELEVAAEREMQRRAAED